MSKKIAFGYIRRIETKQLNSSCLEIPIEIKNLCVIYLYQTEEFDTSHHGSSIKISSSADNKYNDIASNFDKYNWDCVYGTIIVDALKNEYSIYKWTFKFTFDDKYGTPPSIGIVSNDGEWPKEKYCFMRGKKYKYDYYGWQTAWGTLRNFNETKRNQKYDDDDTYPRMKTGDIIIMELNVKRRILKYYKNGVDLGIAFRDIDLEKYKYKLAISIYTPQHTIQIVNFSNQTQ